MVFRGKEVPLVSHNLFPQKLLLAIVVLSTFEEPGTLLYSNAIIYFLRMK